MSTHNDLGRWGEQVAREHLLVQGYAIDGVNVRIGGVEVDFIARKDDRLCFVEVKTRSGDLCDPLDAVDLRKRRRLIKAADVYMRSGGHGGVELLPQFDIILITGTPEGGYRLEHIPDAFYPTL